MDASDMLDVLHFFFEEDTNYASKEHATYTELRRKKLYEVLYETEYKYSFSGHEADNYESESSGIKPFIPPTEFDADDGLPFGDTLDAPLR